MLLFAILLSTLICDITSAQDHENCWEQCFQVGKVTEIQSPFFEKFA